MDYSIAEMREIRRDCKTSMQDARRIVVRRTLISKTAEAKTLEDLKPIIQALAEETLRHA